MLLRVVLSATVLFVFASFSFTFNDDKEMHVHAAFIRETPVAIDLYVLCSVKLLYFIVLSKIMDMNSV